jgi:hypothetical protein
MKELDSSHCTTKGMSSGGGLIHEVRDPSETTSEVLNKDTGVPETVPTEAGIEDKRRLVVETEFVRTLKVMKRPDNILSTILRDIWDTGDLRVIARTTGVKATGAHISILGHITADELQRNLAEGDVANGFLNRFMILCARRSKYLPDGGAEVDIAPFVKKLRAVVEFAHTVGPLKRDEHANKTGIRSIAS